MGLAFLGYRSWAGGAKFRQFFPINFSVYAEVISSPTNNASSSKNIPKIVRSCKAK